MIRPAVADVSAGKRPSQFRERRMATCKKPLYEGVLQNGVHGNKVMRVIDGGDGVVKVSGCKMQLDHLVREMMEKYNNREKALSHTSGIRSTAMEAGRLEYTAHDLERAKI